MKLTDTFHCELTVSCNQILPILHVVYDGFLKTYLFTWHVLYSSESESLGITVWGPPRKKKNLASFALTRIHIPFCNFAQDSLLDQQISNVPRNYEERDGERGIRSERKKSSSVESHSIMVYMIH